MRGIARFFAVFVSFALAAAAVGQEGGKHSWHMKGELEESCSCDAACPCWWGSHPTRMTCAGGQVVFIEKGNYGGVPLDGLAIAGFAESPEGKSMTESVGDWNFEYLYLDAKANTSQRAALEQIASQIFPPIPPERKKIRYVPITRTKDGETHRVTLGEYGTFSAHLLPGGLGGTAKIVNPPVADPIHKEWSQGITEKQTYDDAKKWDFAKTNYMFGSFDVTSADYEKFAADMEKAMKEKKK